MNIKPLADRVLILPAPAEEKTIGGIIIPDTAKEKPLKGEVVATGNGTKDEEMILKVGDTVLYGKYAGTELVIKIVFMSSPLNWRFVFNARNDSFIVWLCSFKLFNVMVSISHPMLLFLSAAVFAPAFTVFFALFFAAPSTLRTGLLLLL